MRLGRVVLRRSLPVWVRRVVNMTTRQKPPNATHVRGRKDIAFALLGDGDCLPQFKDLAHSLEVEQFVHFTGWVEEKELLAYLFTADVCLAPEPPATINQMSTFIKLGDYMACGKATVSFDLLESRRAAGTAAVYVEKDDPALLGEAILGILNNPALREEMGRVAKERVRSFLHWGRSCDVLLGTYDLVIRSSTQLANHCE